MRPGVTIALTAVDRRRLGAIVGNRNVPQKHAWRAEIVLLTADGLGTVEIMRRTGKSKTCVWRWQERFAAEGVDGLLRDKTRPSRVKPLRQEVIDTVVALTATEPPHEATHWTAAAMAEAVGISLSSVQRIWKAHDLQPHRILRFKLSHDPEFVPKLRDVVGLYVDPPAHAVVLSVDEKSCVDGPRLASEKLMAVNGVLAVMCPACSRGAHGRWPRWMSAGWGLIRSSGSKPLTSSG